VKQKYDQLTGQLDFTTWLLTKGKFRLAELHALKFNSKAVSANINSFLKLYVQKSFNKRKQKICEEILVCKEDKQTATKAAIVVLEKIFSLFNLILEKVEHDQDSQLL
jgi:hypothetical protein